MAYDTNPSLTASYVAWAQLCANRDMRAVEKARFLDHSFDEFWNRSDGVTPQQLASAAGTALLGMFLQHHNEGLLTLADEVSKGITPNHRWAKYINGAWITCLPDGWGYTPKLDANNNPTGAADLFFVPPPSGYTVAFDQATVDGANDKVVSFTITSGTVGNTFTWMISSGGQRVEGSGTISTTTQQVTGIDVSSLQRTLTLAVVCTEAAPQWLRSGPVATATVVLTLG